MLTLLSILSKVKNNIFCIFMSALIVPGERAPRVGDLP